jgi:hypothetical protein
MSPYIVINVIVNTKYIQNSSNLLGLGYFGLY